MIENASSNHWPPFGSPDLHLDYVSTGALLAMGVISEKQAPWGMPGQQLRIFTGAEIAANCKRWSILRIGLQKLHPLQTTAIAAFTLSDWAKRVGTRVERLAAGRANRYWTTRDAITGWILYAA